MANNFLNKLRDQHELILKVVLFVISAAIIVLLLPKESKFKYDFQENKPWVHDDLLAPFDFAINKSEAELTFEKNNLKENQLFYFDGDNAKADSARRAVPQWVQDNNSDSLPVEVIIEVVRSAETYLDTLYKTGIFELINELESKNAEAVIVVINERNVGEEVMLGNFFTLKSAYDFVIADLKRNKTPNADFISEAVYNNLVRNIIYNAALTEKDAKSKFDNISFVKGGIYEKEKIISKGEIVSPEKYSVLLSLKAEFESKTGQKQSYWLLIGQSLLVLLLFYAIFSFIKNVNSRVFNSNMDLGFLTIIMVGFVAITALVLRFENISVYVIPYCIIPLLIRTFFGNRLALFVYVIAIFLISFMVPNPFEFIVLQSITGMITLFNVLRVNKRAELFYTAVLIFGIISISFIGFSLIQESNIESIEWEMLGRFGIAAGLTLLTYPLIYLFEKLFGYISDVTLLELADTNNPLLKELNIKAPGTFQHSLQVSNLAEEAIQEIGGNPLLVRTGALYHDIGKMLAPAYFIENQNTGINPHDELGYEESADIIINHVIRGVELAKKHKLPEQIIDFIRTHHGTTKTQYFLKMYQNENPDTEIEEELFQYPGPIPYSKETAVLMMADSVEAASRSLKKYDNESITGLINGIVDGQVAQNQFVNTNITFNDVTLIKKMFIKKLMNIYHVRIEYPK